MKYVVEDTGTGFKLTVLNRANRVVLQQVMEGSHSPLAQAYGILERVWPSTPNAPMEVEEEAGPRIPQEPNVLNHAGIGYFIIESPTQGILKSMEETNGGRVGRFGRELGRNAGMTFATHAQAYRDLDRITPESRRAGCQVRWSHFESNNFRNAWPVVERDGTIVKR